jgi:hypothetical protein
LLTIIAIFVPKMRTAKSQYVSIVLSFRTAKKHQENHVLDNFYQKPFRHILSMRRRNFLTI